MVAEGLVDSLVQVRKVLDGIIIEICGSILLDSLLNLCVKTLLNLRILGQKDTHDAHGRGRRVKTCVEKNAATYIENRYYFLTFPFRF